MPFTIEGCRVEGDELEVFNMFGSMPDGVTYKGRDFDTPPYHGYNFEYRGGTFTFNSEWYIDGYKFGMVWHCFAEASREKDPKELPAMTKVVDEIMATGRPPSGFWG